MRRRRADRASQYQSAAYLSIQGQLAANLRSLREQRGWTQEQAAEKCEMSIVLLQMIEGARSNTTLATLARLCSGFEVSAAALFAPAARPNPRPRGRPKPTSANGRPTRSG